jgi:hypothetical protein
MPDNLVGSLWECITMIEAQEMLKSFKVMDWPNQKKNKRGEIHKDLFKKAYPSSINKKKSIKPEDLQRLLGR